MDQRIKTNCNVICDAWNTIWLTILLSCITVWFDIRYLLQSTTHSVPPKNITRTQYYVSIWKSVASSIWLQNRFMLWGYQLMSSYFILHVNCSLELRLVIHIESSAVKFPLWCKMLYDICFFLVPALHSQT